MPTETIQLSARDGVRLEGRLAIPARAAGGAVLCHPHPQYGGTMSSSLIPAIQRALERRGWAALRFNFRGVGRSEGRYEGGVGELKDVAAALDLVAARTPDAPLAVAGWSFGALVGLAAAVADERVGCYVAVAPPVTMRHDVDLPPLPPDERLRGWSGRALAICGTEDPFCRPRGLEEWARAIPGAEVRIMQGQDHFFSTARDELADVVGAFVAG